MEKTIAWRFRIYSLLCMLCLSIPAWCADSSNKEQIAYVPPHDPYESFNRDMFRFNDFMDTHFLKPLATLYNKIMPKPLNKGIHNVYLNIGELPTIGDDILQLRVTQFLNDVWRLAINTTVGIGGLFDLATRMQLPWYVNDFGLTLANYGYRDSNYFVMPFWGPSTVRDTLAMPVDYFAFEIYPRINPWTRRYALYGLGVIDRRAQLLQYQSLFEEAAIDKYSFIRSAYLQRRAWQVQQNLALGRWGRANLEEKEGT